MSSPEFPSPLSQKNPIGFWDLVLETLGKELSPQQFKTWIQPLKISGFDESERLLFIGAPNPFKLDWIKRTFSLRLNEIASSYFEEPVSLQFILGSDSAKGLAAKEGVEYRANEAANPEGIDGLGINSHGDQLSISDQRFEVERAALDSPIDRGQSKLNPALTFESFVTGKANQLARAASIQVAHNPGSSYNPMFLYGGVGLGKTHLIHAIGNHLLKERPEAKIRYIHAEQYVSDVVRA